MSKTPIPFTRFHLPDGRQTQTEIAVEQDEFEQFEKIRAAGLRMTVELLATGHISMCIEDRALGDFDCVVCANGPAVPAKLREMLLRFDPVAVEEWKHEMA